MIDTRFWDDNYTANLDPIEKLLFLYCLTNTHTNICWVYEIPLKLIAVDTGIDKDMIVKILSRFEKERKILYRDWWIAIINFVKYQNQWSPKVKTWIEKELLKVPKWLNDLIEIPYGYPMDTLSHSNSNSNLTWIWTKLEYEFELNTSSIEEQQAVIAIQEHFWKDEINMMQAFLRQAVWLTAFKDSKERWYVSHCYNLMKKIGKNEFNFRLEAILSDQFKVKNCNKLAYLYGEMKSFIHSPVVEAKWNVAKVW